MKLGTETKLVYVCSYDTYYKFRNQTTLQIWYYVWIKIGGLFVWYLLYNKLSNLSYSQINDNHFSCLNWLIIVLLCWAMNTCHQLSSWLVDCFGFYAVAAIFQQCNGGQLSSEYNTHKINLYNVQSTISLISAVFLCTKYKSFDCFTIRIT